MQTMLARPRRSHHRIALRPGCAHIGRSGHSSASGQRGSGADIGRVRHNSRQLPGVQLPGAFTTRRATVGSYCVLAGLSWCGRRCGGPWRCGPDGAGAGAV